MIWARWAGVMGVPMKWEIARIFVVGTGGSGFCAEAAPSRLIGFFCITALLLFRFWLEVEADRVACASQGLRRSARRCNIQPGFTLLALKTSEKLLEGSYNRLEILFSEVCPFIIVNSLVHGPLLDGSRGVRGRQ